MAALSIKMALYRSPNYQTSLSHLAGRFKRRSLVLISKMVAILDFQLLLIYKSPQYFQWSLSKLPFWFRRNGSKYILLGQPSWISHQNEFRRFWLTSPSNTSYWIFSQWVFVFGRRWEQILKWQLWGGASCISDQSDFSYICLQVTLMILTEIQVNWTFFSEEAKSFQTAAMKVILDFLSNRF